MDDAEMQARQKLVQAHVAALMEHWDSVQIFATKVDHEEGATHSYAWGVGDWYARHGVVREHVMRQERQARLTVDRDFRDDD